MSSTWKSLGGTVLGALVVVSGDGIRLDVFWQGTDLKFYHKWRNSGSIWLPLGTESKEVSSVADVRISVVAPGLGIVDVFVKGYGNNSIWHRRYESTR